MKLLRLVAALVAVSVLLAWTYADDAPSKSERRHPGHQIKTEFIPARPAFKIGEPVEVVLRITNVGDTAFQFMRGGRQRGARDNQFAFSAQLGRRMLPDVGDPIHFGGIGSYVLLKPGEHVDIPVDLTKWFSFDEGGVCMMRGSYVMEFIDTEPGAEVFPGAAALPGAGQPGAPIWVDFACAEFTITISDA